jgi:hypothetical protein
LRIYNRLLLFLAGAFALIDILLALGGQKDISIYFVVNAIAYLIITLLFTYLNPRARGVLNSLSLVIFAGFAVVVAIKVLDVLR